MFVRLLGIAAALAFAVQAGRQEAVFQPGTYRLLACRAGCGDADSTRAYLIGTLVVLPEQIALSDLPPDTHREFQRGARFLRLGTSDGPIGCFALTSSSPLLRGVGLLFAEFEGDTLGFPLYRSPDMGYEVAVVIGEQRLHGRGYLWGAGFLAIDAPSDSILIWRMGPPNLKDCIEAARRRARQ